MRKRKYLSIILLILAIGIGYATLSTTLSINGLSKFKKNTWSVHFENITNKSDNTVNPISATLSQNKKSIDFEVNFTTPGESYTFYTDVVNDGTIDAMFDNYKVEGLNDKMNTILDIKVNYLDGIEVSKYDWLKANTKDTLKIEVSYSEDITVQDLPDADTDFTFTLTITYLQSDENAKVRENGEEDINSPIITKLNTNQIADSIYLDITGHDEYSGITKYYYSKDGGETYIASSNSNYVFTDLDDDDYNIVVYTEDVSGNVSPTMNALVPVHSIYAALYDDGTLILNNSGTLDSQKTLVTNYGNVSRATYDQSTVPWYNNGRSNITTVDVQEVIKPSSTAYWFKDASSLVSLLNIGNLDTSKVTSMSNMFNWTTSLTSLDLSSWNTSNVVDMSYMFTDSYLTSLNVSGWNTGNVTNMAYMFAGSGASTLDFSGWDTSKVTDMSSMFGSSKVTSLDLRGFDTSSVTNMRDMFFDAFRITSIDLRGWDTENVTDMSHMFSKGFSGNSMQLSDIKGIENLNVSNVTDMSYMFQGVSLINLNLNNWITSSLTNMSNMFAEASNLTTLNIGNFNTSNVTQMEAMFYKCSSLENLDISNWNTSKVVEMESMFSEASSLKMLDLSRWDVSSVTRIDYMFFQNTNLTSLDVSNWNTSNVTNFSGFLQAATSIETVDVSSWDTSSATNFINMFCGATSLKYIDVSNFVIPNNCSIWGMFDSTTSLEGLDLSNWDTRNLNNFWHLFNLTSKDASNKTVYYGINSRNLSENFDVNSTIYVTFQYKE